MDHRKPPPVLDDDDERKQIIKEAIDEWLTAQFALFGRWTFYGLLSSFLGAAAYFAFAYHK